MTTSTVSPARVRDFAFLSLLAALIGVGLRRPFLLVCGYVYIDTDIDTVSPQRLTYYLLNSVPVSAVAIGLAALAWAAVDGKRDARVAPQQGLMLLRCARSSASSFTWARWRWSAPPPCPCSRRRSASA